MQKLFVPILIFSLSFLFCNSYVALGRQVLVGGWTPVNPSDPFVNSIGGSAVYLHNGNTQQKLLVFINVVNGKSQVVEGGVNYNLTIKAANLGGADENNYQAIVWDNGKSPKNVRKLISWTGPI